MNVWKRCALLEGHAPPCAAWAHLSDDAVPKGGIRCGSLVEPRVEVYQRVVTAQQLRNEDHRRDVLVWVRLAAAHRGYRGRVQFVRLGDLVVHGAPVDLYGIRVHPARAGVP